jgi:GTP-binding protein Era
MSDQQKSAYITLAGAPNAGKSTLLNRMVGGKVSIVSPKVQTTRTIINGICIHGNAQIIFVDTPGIFTPDKNKNLEKAIVRAAWNQVMESKIVGLLVDSRKGICDNTKNIISRLKQYNVKAVLILNKIDLVNKERLLSITSYLNELFEFERTFMISAMKGEGVNDLLDYFSDISPITPWPFDKDQISTAPIRFLAEEITREALFYRLKQELPYSLYVETEQWEENDKGIVIRQAICVLKESQKKIIIGSGGQDIKEVGQRSRKELSKFMNCNVSLFLFVKVRPKWLDNPQAYNTMGLELKNGDE